MCVSCPTLPFSLRTLFNKRRKNKEATTPDRPNPSSSPASNDDSTESTCPIAPDTFTIERITLREHLGYGRTQKDPVQAIKNFGEKAEGVLEQQKKNVQELVETQKEKIGELLKTKTEEAATTAEATKTAIEGFEGELGKKAEETAEESLQKISATVDEKLKQTEGFLDEKREEAAKTLADKAETAASAASGPATTALEKAKGLIKF